MIFLREINVRIKLIHTVESRYNDVDKLQKLSTLAFIGKFKTKIILLQTTVKLG